MTRRDEKVIEALVKTARPLMLRGVGTQAFKRDSCIAACRIGSQALHHFNVQARVIGVAYIALNAAYVKQVSDEKRVPENIDELSDESHARRLAVQRRALLDAQARVQLRHQRGADQQELPALARLDRALPVGAVRAGDDQGDGAGRGPLIAGAAPGPAPASRILRLESHLLDFRWLSQISTRHGLLDRGPNHLHAREATYAEAVRPGRPGAGAGGGRRNLRLESQAAAAISAPSRSSSTSTSGRQSCSLSRMLRMARVITCFSMPRRRATSACDQPT